MHQCELWGDAGTIEEPLLARLVHGLGIWGLCCTSELLFKLLCIRATLSLE